MTQIDAGLEGVSFGQRRAAGENRGHPLRLGSLAPDMPARTSRKVPSKAGKGRINQAAEPRLSRARRPPEIDVAAWQTALRRRFGREQRFGLENLGTDPVFSDFRVHNPASGTRYRVAIRGRALGQNFCTCPDFATNDLGTCKHIEFTLAPRTEPADAWAAILEAGAALLQGLATARAAGGAAPVMIERDPLTGQASLRLPLPDAAVLQRLAHAFEPCLR